MQNKPKIKHAWFTVGLSSVFISAILTAIAIAAYGIYSISPIFPTIGFVVTVLSCLIMLFGDIIIDLIPQQEWGNIIAVIVLFIVIVILVGSLCIVAFINGGNQR